MTPTRKGMAKSKSWVSRRETGKASWTAKEIETPTAKLIMMARSKVTSMAKAMGWLTPIPTPRARH